MKVETEKAWARAATGDEQARRELERPDGRSRGEAPGIESFERVWSQLELPPVAPAPAGFARQVVERARRRTTLLPELGLSPAWTAVAAALLLAVGIAGGTGLGVYAGETSNGVSDADESDGLADWSEPSLVDDYLSATTDASDSPELQEARP